jgi:prepilin-type N-terminal cleavage/methylation domain-containing protein
MGRRAGFTMVELVIALLIGSILTSIALSSYGNARGRFAVRGARTTFASLHARARAQAIESGSMMRLFVDMKGDSAFDTSCNSFSSAVSLQFWQNADSASVRVMPLGQLVY